MYRKPTYNKYKRKTIWLSIYAIWETYFKILFEKLRTILLAFPKTIYSLMLTSILISLGCFFYWRQKEPPVLNEQTSFSLPLTSGIKEIYNSTTNLNQAIELQMVLDNLFKKKVWNMQDSMLFFYAIEKMQILEKGMPVSKQVDSIQ